MDNTPQTADVSYSTTEATNGNVTVTITADEEIQEVNGWTLSSDGITLTKTYTTNAEETITIYDIAGNSTDITLTVQNINTTTDDEDNANSSVSSTTDDGDNSNTNTDNTTATENLATSSFPYTGLETVIKIAMVLFLVVAI